MILRRSTIAALLSVSVLAVLLYLIGSGYSVSAEGEEPLRLPGSDVIEYDHSDSFAIQDPVRSIDQGEGVGDACKFTTRLERAFGEPAKVARTLAVDFTTCEKLVEKGTLTPEDLETIIEHDATESSPAQGLNPGRTDTETVGSSGLLSSNTNTAKFRTTWEDPPNLDVNWVESMVKWRNDTENDVVVYDSGKCSWYWLWITGWTDEGGSCWWSYEDSNQWLVMVDTIHDFDNTSFPCPDGLGLGFGAATNYDPNRVGGSLYGSWGTSTTTATGDCAYLLDSRDVLY